MKEFNAKECLFMFIKYIRPEYNKSNLSKAIGISRPTLDSYTEKHKDTDVLEYIAYYLNFDLLQIQDRNNFPIPKIEDILLIRLIRYLNVTQLPAIATKNTGRKNRSIILVWYNRFTRSSDEVLWMKNGKVKLKNSNKTYKRADLGGEIYYSRPDDHSIKITSFSPGFVVSQKVIASALNVSNPIATKYKKILKDSGYVTITEGKKIFKNGKFFKRNVDKIKFIKSKITIPKFKKK